MIGLSKVKVR